LELLTADTKDPALPRIAANVGASAAVTPVHLDASVPLLK
jgi:hypothetical protein